MINLIAACGNNRVIGKDGRLPWHIQEDWDYFMQTTKNGSMIMGHTCYQEFAPHSKNRDVIALTRNPHFHFPLAKTANSLQAAISLASRNTIWICGGAALYKEAFPLASRLYLTLIEGDFVGDVYFPPWEQTFNKVISKKNIKHPEFSLQFLILEKTNNT